MANTTNTTSEPTQALAPAKAPVTPLAMAVTFAGWVFPGLGHLILRRWVRGLLIMASILVLFFSGLGMQGKVYSFNTGDLLEILGFFGDIGAGALFFIAHAMDWGQGAIHRATADYGTKYIIVAGLLNIISTIDAFHIATGKKK